MMPSGQNKRANGQFYFLLENCIYLRSGVDYASACSHGKRERKLSSPTTCMVLSAMALLSLLDFLLFLAYGGFPIAEKQLLSLLTIYGVSTPNLCPQGGLSSMK